jgi:hypothetical protein
LTTPVRERTPASQRSYKSSDDGGGHGGPEPTWHHPASQRGTADAPAPGQMLHLLCLGTALAAATPAEHSQPWVSWWFDTHWTNSGNASAALSLLNRQGGARVATSVLLYCGDFVAANGAIQAGTEGRNASAHYCSQAVCCNAMATQLRGMGIAVERVITLPVRGDVTTGSSSPGDLLASLRQMLANPAPAISGLVSLAAEHKLRGISFDVECKSTPADARAFARFCARLRDALRPLGARLTVYSNVHDDAISNISLLASSVDRVLDGDTYNYQSMDCPDEFVPFGDGSACQSLKNRTEQCTLWGNPKKPPCPSTGGSNFSHWLEHYDRFVRAAPVTKMGVGMKASTGRGIWNCNKTGIAQKLRQLRADKVPELAIFELKTTPPCDLSVASPECGCSDMWFEAARAFLAH